MVPIDNRGHILTIYGDFREVFNKAKQRHLRRISLFIIQLIWSPATIGHVGRLQLSGVDLNRVQLSGVELTRVQSS